MVEKGVKIHQRISPFSPTGIPDARPEVQGCVEPLWILMPKIISRGDIHRRVCHGDGGGLDTISASGALRADFPFAPIVTVESGLQTMTISLPKNTSNSREGTDKDSHLERLVSNASDPRKKNQTCNIRWGFVSPPPSSLLESFGIRGRGVHPIESKLPAGISPRWLGKKPIIRLPASPCRLWGNLLNDPTV